MKKEIGHITLVVWNDESVTLTWKTDGYDGELEGSHSPEDVTEFACVQIHQIIDESKHEDS